MKWDSDLATWITALSLYKPAIDHRDSHNNKSGIATLDSYIWETLTPLVRSRTPPFIHASEYSKVVQWKLKRGRWRPRLQAFADDTTQHEVVDASRQAYVALQTADIKQALAPLIFLKGCGPATASAILALADDSVPFMSDELLLAAQGEGKRQYTVNVCVYPPQFSPMKHLFIFLTLIIITGIHAACRKGPRKGTAAHATVDKFHMDST